MRFTQITSVHNPAIKHVCRLRERRIREREQLTILEGYRDLARGFEYGLAIEECYFCPEMFLGENEYPLLSRLAEHGARIIEVPSALLRKMAYRDRPEGLIAISRMKNHDISEMPRRPDGLYLVAESVEKPGNLGSMLRSADAAGADGLIICDKCTDIYNPNTIRASTGALFSVPVAETTAQGAIDWLRESKIAIVAATPHAESLYTDADMRQGVAVVVGAEQYGLSPFWLDNSDFKVRIPMLGRIDSLNVTTAATILLYEAARQRGWRKPNIQQPAKSNAK